MTLVKEIQKFLRSKFEKLKLTRKNFSEQSGIPYNNITNIMNELRSNPQMDTLLKIANYFECFIDEVVGRNEYLSLLQSKGRFKDLSSDDISNNLKEFLKDKSAKQDINLYVLGKKIGFNYSIHNFVNGSRKQKTLNTQIVVALADYFQISLDEMVGRINPVTSDNDKPSQQKTNRDTEPK
ncbi:MAG: helix-turn-helix domain-containing protein [Rickettsia endosymbiont of Pseudomimeciton antennatum]|nr:helix-turn-helix domain-containing protein [Rickettsia endosymbiont of Pseudomimeciton antennatum]MCC8398643.1 helix-turn-helix domain-containing protein [Rickettsia endosymbiont of Labidopullus appendiculatus]